MNSVSAPNLRAFREQLPKTRIGILRLLWPTIQECLDGGHTLRDIHQTLRLDGIDMAYSTLCWAVAELRQSGPPERSAPAKNTESPTAPLGREKGSAVRHGTDPLGNLKRMTERRPGFEYTGTLPDEKLFGSK
jgi:hypothetical protein